MEEITLDSRSITVIIKKYFSSKKERVIVKKEVTHLDDETIDVQFRTISEGETWEKPVPRDLFEKILRTHLETVNFDITEYSFISAPNGEYAVKIRGKIKGLENERHIWHVKFDMSF